MLEEVMFWAVAKIGTATRAASVMPMMRTVWRQLPASAIPTMVTSPLIGEEVETLAQPYALLQQRYRDVTVPDRPRGASSALTSRIDLPPEPNRHPEGSAQRDPDSNQRRHGRREIRIDHENEAGDELRPPFLFLAVDEQHETDAARDKRQKQPGGVERHAADDTQPAY